MNTNNEKETEKIKEETTETTETNTDDQTSTNDQQDKQPEQPEPSKPVETSQKEVLDNILTFLKQNQVTQQTYIDAIKEMKTTQDKLVKQLNELDEIVKENTPRIVKSFDYFKESQKYNDEIQDTRKIAEEAFNKMKQSI